MRADKIADGEKYQDAVIKNMFTFEGVAERSQLVLGRDGVESCA
jgi:hypothetical protein